MSEHQRDTTPPPAGALTIDELARLQNAEETRDAKELAADIWESDAELDAFLADLRSSRDASLA
ncbi:MAG TPA: hypothetical protein VMZ33_00210 [Candidatus Limnocylindrales bacterium]|nr:hypothetical protein [Candidatus Limnocylindrales bacterium]